MIARVVKDEDVTLDRIGKKPTFYFFIYWE